MTKTPCLTKRYNADKSVSLYCNGRVVLSRQRDQRSIDAFCIGWFGTDDRTAWKFNRSIIGDAVAA